MGTQLETMEERVRALEERLSLNSRNSSKPPSTDSAPKPKSLRGKSGKKPGGQPGHKGASLKWVETPDRLEVHSPGECRYCGASLADGEALGCQRRQVVDLPELRLEVTEHRALRKQCRVCRQGTEAAFPCGVVAGVGYGPRIKSLGVYLNQYQLLPYERVSRLLRDLFNAGLSVGTLYSAIEQCHEALSKTEEVIKQGVQQAEVANYDETGLDVAGRRMWLHVASTGRLTHYGAHPRRGSLATDAIGILPEFTGTAVHDAWSSYPKYSCRHALCNVHHLRELTCLEEQGQGWASGMIRLLLEIKRTVCEAVEQGETGLSQKSLAWYEMRYQDLIEQGMVVNPLPSERTGKRGPVKRSKGRNLVERLDKRRDEVLCFMHDLRVPFDNNQAERDVRMVKVQQKVSGCFRTMEGAQMFCRIRAYISTARKQGFNPLAALETALRKQPLILTPAE
ncbi:MAG: IS66 family transposase [Chloroflexia bacterium]|nr:IS66 family transposase [Chloroflexia bacterium]